MFDSQRIAVALALLAIGTSASAQSAMGPRQQGPRDNRMQVGIVIPFGNAGSEAERAPRFEAWSEPGRYPDSAMLQIDRDAVMIQSTRIGITLDRQARLMINGREAPQRDGEHGISGIGVAGIVVGVVVLAAAVFVIEYKTSGLGD
jgi:hypothetical protein